MSKKTRPYNSGEIGLTVVSIILIAAIFALSFYFLPLDKGAGGGAEHPEEPTEVKFTFASKSLDALFTTIDLQDATISELQSEMAAGNLTSEQLTQMYIDRILAYDGVLDLNSVIAINPAALEDARRLDIERAEGNVRGPLHGIPVIVKANIDVRGMATSAGTRSLADMIVTKDAFAVKRLREAGAVIIGQANMSEFAYATVSSRSTLGGIVHNPYDTTRTPGGSSGGTGVAVTCNFAAAGLGTDTGGSIRNPSSLTNLYGMRPSKGLTSISGVFPLKAYKDVVGPMTRTAEDMAVVLGAVAGADKEDDYTVEARASVLLGDGYMSALTEDGLEGMRIGYLTYSFSYGRRSLNDNINQLLGETLDCLESAGAELVDVSDVFTQELIWRLANSMDTDTFEYDVNRYLSQKGDDAVHKTLREIYYSNYDGSMYMYLDNVTGGQRYFAGSLDSTYDPYTETVGPYKRVPGWSKMLEERAMISEMMEEADIDAVVYMNLFDVAEKEQPRIVDPYNWAGYDIVFGPKHGLPEISLPMGFSGTDWAHDTEMPLGLSVFSGFGQEKTLIRIAYAYEKQAGSVIRRVPANVPPLPDERLVAFLTELIHRAYDITDSDYDRAYSGLVQTMTDACKKAEEVDKMDPYAVYAAASDLAAIYDKVIAALGQTN